MNHIKGKIVEAGGLCQAYIAIETDREQLSAYPRNLIQQECVVLLAPDFAKVELFESHSRQLERLTAHWTAEMPVAAPSDHADAAPHPEIRLRGALSKVATNLGNGSAASPGASLEFLCDCVPNEVKLHNEIVRNALKNAGDYIHSLSRGPEALEICAFIKRILR